jgi:hypothetical protein
MAASKILEALEKFSERYSSDRSLFPVASADISTPDNIYSAVGEADECQLNSQHESGK